MIDGLLYRVGSRQDWLTRRCASQMSDLAGADKIMYKIHDRGWGNEQAGRRWDKRQGNVPGIMLDYIG